jgi:hypothetical protein
MRRKLLAALGVSALMLSGCVAVPVSEPVPAYGYYYGPPAATFSFGFYGGHHHGHHHGGRYRHRH